MLVTYSPLFLGHDKHGYDANRILGPITDEQLSKYYIRWTVLTFSTAGLSAEDSIGGTKLTIFKLSNFIHCVKIALL